MKKNIKLLFVFLCFLFIFVSCAKKTTPNDENNNRVDTKPETTPIEYTAPPVNQGTSQTTPAQPATPTPPAEPQRVLISSYQTTLLNKDKDRTDNIKLASSKISGLKIAPGKTFSFNEVVGQRNSQRGFKEATAIINGKYDDAVGGGICQLSSTIFNAADKAGLAIVERHSHTIPVAYVPKGRDATVVFGSLDFKFKNTKDYTIELETRVQGGKVTATIYKSRT